LRNLLPPPAVSPPSPRCCIISLIILPVLSQPHSPVMSSLLTHTVCITAPGHLPPAASSLYVLHLLQNGPIPYFLCYTVYYFCVPVVSSPCVLHPSQPPWPPPPGGGR
jgi:hypothetical protein